MFAKTVDYKGIPVNISKSILLNQINLNFISSAISGAPVALLGNAPWTIYFVSGTDLTPTPQFETDLPIPVIASGPDIYFILNIGQPGNANKNNDQKMFAYSLYHSWLHVMCQPIGPELRLWKTRRILSPCI